MSLWLLNQTNINQSGPFSVCITADSAKYQHLFHLNSEVCSVPVFKAVRQRLARGEAWCWITRAWRLGSCMLETLLIAARSLTIGGSQNCSSEWCILFLWVKWSLAPRIRPEIALIMSLVLQGLSEMNSWKSFYIVRLQIFTLVLGFIIYPLLSHLLQHSQRFIFIALCTTVSWRESPEIEQLFSWYESRSWIQFTGQSNIVLLYM